MGAIGYSRRDRVGVKHWHQHTGTMAEISVPMLHPYISRVTRVVVRSLFWQIDIAIALNARKGRF